MMAGMIECVVNISEGRDRRKIEHVAKGAAGLLLDLHVDGHHNRSVLTIGGGGADVEAAARQVVERAINTIDLRAHTGVHPRMGAADVVPFVPLDGAVDTVVGARDRTARFIGDVLRVPSFLYGPDRTLPAVRRGAFAQLFPDYGPRHPHPRAGATAVGARGSLVAYNVWIEGPGIGGAEPAEPDVGVTDVARQVAAAVRGPGLRAIGVPYGAGAQVSCNLVDPDRLGPDRAYDLIATALEHRGGGVVRAELVGLVPESVLRAVPTHRWRELDLSASRTIEARLEAR